MTRPRRRLLVALAVTGSVAHEVDGLRRAAGSVSLDRIEPHLTLIAPINVRDDALGDALIRVRQTASLDPIEIELGPARTFAPHSPVVYLAVDAQNSPLERLREELAQAPFEPPSDRVERAFVPHVTIASGLDPSRIPAMLESFGQFRVSAVLSTLALYEQDPDDSRHRWHRIADVTLGSLRTVGRGGRPVDFITSTRPPPDAASWAGPFVARTGDLEEPVVVSALVNDKVVGIAVGALIADRVAIEQFQIAPRDQSGGIGGQLLGELERLASESGRRMLTMLCPRVCPVARFLASRGYTIVSEAEPGPEDLVFYGRLVGPPDAARGYSPVMSWN